MMKKICIWEWFVPPVGTAIVFLLLSLLAKQQVINYLFAPVGFLIFMLVMAVMTISAVVFREEYTQRNMPLEDEDRQKLQQTLYQIFAVAWGLYCIISCGYIVFHKV